jgi:short-chain Z-isoprenyl diphosphate synthase
MTLTIAVGYGGREEIADAVRSFLKDQMQQGASLLDVVEHITPDAITGHLYAANLPDPDLIIRTSGEIRLSGFLLWQSAHSEFYFTDVLWPDFRKIDFLRAIRAYQSRSPQVWAMILRHGQNGALDFSLDFGALVKVLRTRATEYREFCAHQS